MPASISKLTPEGSEKSCRFERLRASENPYAGISLLSLPASCCTFTFVEPSHVQENPPCFPSPRLALLLGACSPTVRLEAPEKPIEINMNLNIRHEILVKVEKDVQQLFDENKGLF